MHASLQTEIAPARQGLSSRSSGSTARWTPASLVICDHASNGLPAEYGDLGLTRQSLQRHIAYDIGAAWLTRRLAASARRAGGALDLLAPADRSRTAAPTIRPSSCACPTARSCRAMRGSTPTKSSAGARFIGRPIATPSRETVDAMCATGVAPAVVSIHSFTPIWRGARASLESRRAVGCRIRGCRSRCFRLWPRRAILRRRMRRSATTNLMTAPSKATRSTTIATARGLANALIEVRQDLIATEPEAEAWAERLARLLRPILARPELHARARFRQPRIGQTAPIRRTAGMSSRSA